MSPGLTVSDKPVAPLLVLPGTAQIGPGRRGNNTNSTIISGNDCTSSLRQERPSGAGRAAGRGG